ncbi:1,4-dihydroxy-2-naphthoate octaprenyltransferase [Candidatus Pacearchaeota archaeon]|nr:1,4-dihydroxy-2-naphthoate octaprenyltransferase [Candidatus Pacearchaeota archaeon]
MKFRVWFRAIRLPFFTATLAPIVFGTVFAYYWEHRFNGWRFLLVIIGTLLVQGGLNLANDYFDNLSGNDELTKPTPVSGGSRVIQEGLLKPETMILVSIICFLGATLIGLYLNFTLKGNFILIFGIIGMILAFFYSAPPLKIGYRSGLGELSCAIGIGPIIILGAYYVQTQNFSLPALLVSLPLGILIGLVLLINEFPDYEADQQVHKNTLVVTCGPQKAAFIIVGFLAIAYIITVMLILMEMLPKIALFVLITTPLAYFIARKVLAHYGDIKKLLPANIAMIRLHLLFSIMLIITLLIQ